MSDGNINPIHRRKTLLIAAGIFMLLAILNQPALLLFITSPVGLIYIILIATAGFFAAKGIREFADVFLKKPGYPWYSRQGAFVFLAIIMPIINAIYTIFDGIAFSAFRTIHNYPCSTNIFMFIAFELLWIVILELPQQNNDRDNSNSQPSARPRFTYFKRNTFYK